MDTLKKHAWSLYLIILICFAMPFITVTCDGEKEPVANGFQMAMESTYYNGKETKETVKIPRIAGSISAVLAGLIGVAFIRKSLIKYIVGATANAVSIVLLIAFRMDILKYVFKDAEHELQVDFHYGYWVVLALNLAVFVIMLYFAVMSGKYKRQTTEGNT